MSGGGLNRWDDCSKLYLIDEWKVFIEPENPLLAEMLADLKELLEGYDYWLAGDSGRDRVEKEWKHFSEKWLTKSSDTICEIMTERCRKLIESIKSGHISE